MQGLGEDSVRASSPIWASVASRARTRSLLACYGGQNELSNTRNAYFIHIFNTLDLPRPEKNAIENSINGSVRSTSLR